MERVVRVLLLYYMSIMLGCFSASNCKIKIDRYNKSKSDKNLGKRKQDSLT